jgi:stringent starvation protein B
MSSNRPYLLRAIYDWISDNNLTPYMLVDATRKGVMVPPHVIKDGQVVLNLAMRAVANLDLGNEPPSDTPSPPEPEPPSGNGNKPKRGGGSHLRVVK